MSRSSSIPWGEDRPANPCKAFSFDPSKNLDDQIDQALWKFGRKESGIVAIWLPDNFKGKVLDRMAGIPIKFTRYNCGQEIWLEMSG